MRIATTISSTGLLLLLVLLSGATRVGGGDAGDERLYHLGGGGWLVTLLLLVGAGAAYDRPFPAAGAFALAGVSASAIAATDASATMALWALCAGVLAAMSLMGGLRLRREQRRLAIYERIDEELIPGPPALPALGRCPRCATTVAHGARACLRCGEPLSDAPAA